MTSARPCTLDELAELVAPVEAELSLPITATVAWAARWVDSHPDLRGVGVLITDDEDRPTAWMPLAYRRRHGMLDLTAAAYGAADLAPTPAVDRHAAGTLAVAIIAVADRLGRPWRLRLEQVPVGDPLLTTLSTAQNAVVGVGTPCPVADLTEGSVGSRGWRKQQNQARNRLERDGRVLDLEHLTTRDGIAAVLDDLADVRRRRDHDSGRRSELDDPRWLAFWQRTLLDLADAGQVEVTVARVDGAVAAYDVALLDGDVTRLWDGRFHPDGERYWLGQVVDGEVARRAVERGATALDLMRGDTTYKRRIADGATETRTLALYSHGWLRDVDTRTLHAVEWARDLKRSVSWLEAGYRMVKRRVQDLDD